jgi:hypothetical protein
MKGVPPLQTDEHGVVVHRDEEESRFVVVGGSLLDFEKRLIFPHDQCLRVAVKFRSIFAFDI